MIIQGIVFFLLFIIPFIIAPFGITQFENPKVVFTEAGIILLFLVELFTNSFHIRLKKQQIILYCGIFLLTILQLIFLRTNLLLFGNAFRMQGIFLLWFLLAFSILSSFVSFKKIPWYAYTFLLIAECVATLFLPINESQRAVGTLGEPNALAAFAIFLWPFSFFSVKNFGRKEKLGIGLNFILVTTIFILSGSRSGAIAFAIQLILISMQKISISKTKIIITCLFLYGVSYIFPLSNQNPYENRVEVWKSAISAGFARPIVGWGFGNGETALHLSAKKNGLPIQYYYVDSAHNIFLDWWVEGGIVGLGIILSLVYFTFRSFITTGNTDNLVLFFGILTVLSFNPASIVGLMGFWYLLGQGFS